MSERIIFHIDVNSAFLSWQACNMLHEDANAVDIRTIASVIGGNEETRHGIVLAKSTIAKSYGIKTGEPLVAARRKCPKLVTVSPSYGVYADYSNQFMALLRKYAPVVEQFSIDEAFCDMTGTGMLYGDPVEFAHKLKDIIKNELGFTVNIGVAHNKLLAKMASDFQKPDRVHTLFESEIPAKMWPLPVGELFFVGGSTVSRLNSLGIKTIGDLANTDISILKSNFKRHGQTMWNYANGYDLEMVTDHQIANKGYGNSVTISYDVTDSDTAINILLSLCETVGARIRAAKSNIGVVSVTIVGNDFTKTSRQKALLSTTNATSVIYDTAKELFMQLWDNTPIRLLGVSTNKASEESYEQMSLFDGGKSEKMKKLDSAIDKIRGNFGNDALKRASLMTNEKSSSKNNVSIPPK